MPRSPRTRSLYTASTLILVLATVKLTSAQVPSDLDSMRVSASPVVGRGQEVNIDVSIRVVDTLGAFAYRLLYDTAVFEPVQDTHVVVNDTFVNIIASDLRPGIFEQFAGSVRSPGVITFLAADLDLDTADLFLPGSGPVVRMRWRVLPQAPIGVTQIYFENDSVQPATWNAFSDWWGEDFIRPVMVNAETTVNCGCQCFADPGNCDGIVDIVDVLMAVGIAFRAMPAVPDPGLFCFHPRTDVDCDGATGVLDVVSFIEVAFRNADPSATFCVPCE